MGGTDRTANGAPSFGAQKVVLNYPEVFSGAICFEYGDFRDVKIGPNAFFPAMLKRPDDHALTLAKQRPLILIQPDQQGDDYHTAVAKSLATEGFHTKVATLTTEQFHYPNYSTDWLGDDIKFLDEWTAKLKTPVAATKPAAASQGK